MKHILRLAIILAISLLGELLNAWIPLPIPGSIYGLVLMLVGLCTGIIPLEKVQSTSRFLIEIMPVMFVPAAVGLIENWAAVRPMLIPTLIIMVASTFLVMGISGYVTQALMRRSRSEAGREDAK